MHYGIITLTTTTGSELRLLVSPAIPIAVFEDEGCTRVLTPTHNNGGWKVTETLDEVLDKIEMALS